MTQEAGVRFGAVIVALAIVGVAIWVGYNLTLAHDVGQCKRFMADTRSIANAVEEYQIRYGQYPAAMTLEELRGSIEPEFMRKAPTRGIRYFSDGAGYTVITVPGDLDEAGGSVNAYSCSYLELRDGEFVSWPEIVGHLFQE